MNYHPNATAQRLAGRRMNTLGVLFGEIESDILTNPYAAMVLQGIVSEAAKAHYNVTVFTLRWESAEVSALALRDGRTDGVLVVAPRIDSDVVSGLSALCIPIVCLSGPSGVAGVPFVDVDNARGARLATEHLLSLGHTRIAHIGGEEHHSDVLMRRTAFLRTMTSAGVPVEPDYLPEGTYHWAQATENVRRLLTRPKPPTAIFAANDTLAILVLETARSLRLRVPEDLSIVGFDDMAMASIVSPALTTVRQPLREIGARAARLLVDMVEVGEYRHTPAPDDDWRSDGTLLESALIVRETTGPAHGDRRESRRSKIFRNSPQI